MVDSISYQQYVDYNEIFPGEEQGHTKNRLSDIKKEVQFFNEKVASILKMPFIFRLLTVRSFFLLIQESNCAIYVGNCIKTGARLCSRCILVLHC